MTTASQRSTRSDWTWPRALWLVWGGIGVGASLVVVLTLLPPWLSPETRAVLMQAFSSLCHQIPSRSPTVDGVSLAVCDRCLGIYAGFALGVILAAVVRVVAPVFASRAFAGKQGKQEVAATYRRLFDRAKFVLIGALVPLALDWAGPVVQELVPAFGWTNTPLSRALTGGFLGMTAAVLLIISIAKNVLHSRANRETGGTDREDSRDSEGTIEARGRM